MRLDLGPSLSDLKTSATIAVDAAAEEARIRYITPGAGQAAIYLKKEAEARSFVAPGDATTYPLLAAERDAQIAVGISATLTTVAAEVVAQADDWLAAGATIERLRREAKLKIVAATTPAQVKAATEITWPTP